MSERADGTYPATIVSAYVIEDQWDEGEYVIKIDANLDGGGAVTAQAKMAAGDAKTQARRDAVLKELGLTWPCKSKDLAAIVGREVRINLKTSAKGRQNAYIATARPEVVLTPEQLDAMADNSDSDLPF